MGMGRKLVRNTAMSGLSSSVSALVGFILLPILVGVLGPVQYGLIGFARVFSVSGGVGAVTDLGLRQAVVKYVAEFAAQNAYVELQGTVFASLALLGGTGIVFAAAGFAMVGPLTAMLAVPEAYEASFRVALAIVFLSYALELPNVVFEGVLEGFQEYPALGGIQAAYSVLYAVSAAAAVTMGYSYVAVVALGVATRLLTTSAAAVWALRKCGPWSHEAMRPSMGAFRRLLGMGRPLLSAQLSSTAGYHVERLLIAFMLSPAVMTAYDVLVKLPRFLKSSLSFLGAAVMPAASELAANNDSERSGRLFQEGLRLSLILTTPVTFGAMVAAGPFLELWIGPEWVYLADLMRLMLVVNILSPIANFGWRILIGSNTDVHVIPLLQWVNTLIKVAILSFLLDRIGLWAVAAATLSLIVTLPVSFGIFVRRLGLSLWSESRSVAFILVLSLISALTVAAWERIHPFSGLLELTVAVSAGSGVCVALIAITGISPFLHKKARAAF